MKSAWNRFWFEQRLSDLHLAIFRVVFFGLLAVDAWLQIVHAPRYGAGDFNVPHFGWLGSVLPAPSRAVMLVVFAAQAYLAGAFAVGRLSRSWLGLLTALYGYSYFVSQLDSYQHHWLMFVILVLLCLVSWHPRERAEQPVGDWPIRLILVVVSMVYVWAVIAKWDPLWFDGRTIAQQVRDDWARDLVERTLRMGATDPLAPWALLAKLVVVAELTLAFALHVRWLRWPTFVVGVLFHIGIETSGFEIGLFSYFMVAIYLLVLPFEPLQSWFAGRWPRSSRKDVSASERSRPGWVVLGSAVLMLLVGPVLVALCLPFAESALIAALCGLGGVTMVALAYRRRSCLTRAAVAHLCACLILVSLVPATDVARDYYRFWGGSSRRLGLTEEATAAYRQVVAVDPEYASGYVSLGNLVNTTDPEEALDLYEKAQKLAPSDFRGFLGAAQIHHRAGRRDPALAAARLAEALAPPNQKAQAQAILRAWSN